MFSLSDMSMICPCSYVSSYRRLYLCLSVRCNLFRPQPRITNSTHSSSTLTLTLTLALTPSGIRFTPTAAGHVLGAAMFTIEIDGIRVLYTGDYSMEEDRHLMKAETPPG